jgi:hypothetical protein
MQSEGNRVKIAARRKKDLGELTLKVFLLLILLK